MTLQSASVLSALCATNPSDRLSGLIRYLAGEVESSAAALALVRDRRNHQLIASVGYQTQTVDHLLGRLTDRDRGMRLVYERPYQMLTWDDVPSFRSTYSASEVFVPAGFNQGASVALPDSDGRPIALLHMSIVQSDFPLWLKDFVMDILDLAASAASLLAVRSQVMLTRREIDVLRHLVDGSTNSEIAGALYLSRSTVNTHVEHILHKLGARNRLSAAVLATKWCLLEDQEVLRTRTR